MQCRKPALSTWDVFEVYQVRPSQVTDETTMGMDMDHRTEAMMHHETTESGMMHHEMGPGRQMVE